MDEPTAVACHGSRWPPADPARPASSYACIIAVSGPELSSVVNLSPLSVRVSFFGRSIAVLERGNARVQIFDDHGRCLSVIKTFHWSRDLQIGSELTVDQSGTVEELGLPTGGESD